MRLGPFVAAILALSCYSRVQSMEDTRSQELIQAVEKNEVETVRRLLEQGVDPNAAYTVYVGGQSVRYPALTIAGMNNNLPIIQLL